MAGGDTVQRCFREETPLDDLIKHVRLVHAAVLVASLAITVSTVVGTGSLRSRAEEEFREVQLALFRWRDINFDSLSQAVKEPLRTLLESPVTIQRLGDAVSLHELLAEVRQMTTEDEELINIGFPDNFVDRMEGHFSKHHVLVRDTEWLGRPAKLFLLIDPITCLGGGLPARTIGELRSFWAEMTQPNRCHVLAGVDEIPVFSDIPESEWWSMGLMFYEDVVVLAEGIALNVTTGDDPDPHDEIAPYGLQANVVLAGARNVGEISYRATWPHVVGAGRAGLMELEADPLLQHFDAGLPRTTFEVAFPALAEVIRDYPEDLSLGHLGDVMALEATRDAEDVKPLPGIVLPPNLVVVLGLPLLVALVTYLLVILGEVRHGLGGVERLPEQPWLGLMGGELAAPLTYTSLMMPAGAASFALWDAATGTASLIGVTLAGACGTISVLVGVRAALLVRQMRRDLLDRSLTFP